jgi:hypothetical protein
VAILTGQTRDVDVTATLDAACSTDRLRTWVGELDRYPAWLSIVPRADREASPTEPTTAVDEGHPAWAVELRAKLGSGANRLDHVFNNLSNMRTNTEAAKGRIMDVDYASETATMTKNQLLLQAGTSMLKQSSSMSQLVLSLMQ